MESTFADAVPPLVTVSWLASQLQQGGIVVVDASWYLPDSGRDAGTEYRAAHIPGAVRLDWAAVSDDATDLPHMLPSPQRFAAAMESLGIGPQHAVIVYDGSGTNLSAPRAWWMFRAFGHDRVAVLDGGFQSWAGATRPVQIGPTNRPTTGYPVPTLNASLVRDRSAIDAIVNGDDSSQVLDCRPTSRFLGDEPEPRLGLRRGHIPGSRNIPHVEFTDPQTHELLRPPALRNLLASRGLDPGKPIVASCGSGMSAAVAALAIEVLRGAGDIVGPPVAIYDGSWAEYGRS